MGAAPRTAWLPAPPGSLRRDVAKRPEPAAGRAPRGRPRHPRGRRHPPPDRHGGAARGPPDARCRMGGKTSGGRRVLTLPPLDRLIDRFAVILVALAAMLWGTDALFRAPLLMHLSSDRLVQSTQLVFMEHLILVILCLPLLWRARHEIRRLNAAQWQAIAAIGVGASALATVLFTLSFGYGHFIETLLLQKVQPLFAIVLANLWLRERISPQAWLWLPRPGQHTSFAGHPGRAGVPDHRRPGQSLPGHATPVDHELAGGRHRRPLAGDRGTRLRQRPPAGPPAAGRRRLAGRRGQLEDRYPPGRLVGIVEDLGGAQYRPDHPGSERYAADVGSEDVFEEPGRLFRGQLRCLDGILVSVSGDPPRARDP